MEYFQNNSLKPIQKMSKGLPLYEKETATHMFSCEFCQIFKNTFFPEHLWWLLLPIDPLQPGVAFLYPLKKSLENL